MSVVMLTGWGECMVEKGDVPEDVDLVLGKPPTLRTLRAAGGVAGYKAPRFLPEKA